MTGKLVPRTTADAIGPQTANVHQIANTGNAADYKWIAEPGEDFDNQIQPSFATVKGMFLNDADPLSSLDALTLLFSDNWFDSNFGNNERFLLITSALELVFINALITAGAGTESAFKLKRDGDISGANAAGYLGTLKGSWKLVKIHPEFLPKVFTDASLVVDPVATTATGGRTLRQVVALAAYKGAIQTYEHFSEKRQQDGGVRFKGTEYVQDFSYDCWAIDQLSEGIVPLFLPGSLANLSVVDTSFTNVAAKVAAARAQLSVSPVTYPLSGRDTLVSRPEWYNSPYTQNGKLDATLPEQSTGDVAAKRPINVADNPAAGVAALAEQVVASSTARANSTAVALGDIRKFSSPTSLWKVTTAGTTAAAQPSITGKNVGDSVTDGTAVFIRTI
jgi:hypothetical protein